MTKEAPTPAGDGYTEVSDQLKKTTEELNSVLEQKEEIAQRCHELDLQVCTQVSTIPCSFHRNGLSYWSSS